MISNKTKILGVVILAAALGARAQTITWGTAESITGTSDVITTGTLLGTLAPGDSSSASLPVNGVTFAPNSLPDFSSSGFAATANYLGSPGTADANYNALLECGEYGSYYNYNPTFITASLTWGGGRHL